MLRFLSAASPQGEFVDNRQEKDELRARFTVWLETLLHRAKIDYIRHEKKRPSTVSLEAVHEMRDEKDLEDLVEDHEDFNFADERLRSAFMRLSPSKRKILVLLFVGGLEPDVVARELGCTVQHIYNLRSKAIKDLKKYMGIP